MKVDKRDLLKDIFDMDVDVRGNRLICASLFVKEKTASGLILTSTSYSMKTVADVLPIGYVLKIGDECFDNIDTACKAVTTGTFVFYNNFSRAKLPIDNHPIINSTQFLNPFLFFLDDVSIVSTIEAKDLSKLVKFDILTDYFSLKGN